MDNHLYIGVDIGGTTFTSAIFNTEGRLLIKSSKDLISNYSNRVDLLNGIVNQIKIIKSDKSINGVGVSCPGPLNARSGMILNTPNLKLLQNFNLKNELELQLKIPCKIENDANLFTLGEYSKYKLKKDVFVGVTLGTGLGFGIIINGKLFKGGNGMAAEYGISPVNNFNWESLNSIRWISNQTQKLFDYDISPSKLFEMAENKNQKAISIWDEFGKNLGMCLSHIINMIDPNTITIGGGLSHAFTYFSKSMKEIIILYSPSYLYNNINIYESELKENSGMLGASLLF